MIISVWWYRWQWWFSQMWRWSCWRAFKMFWNMWWIVNMYHCLFNRLWKWTERLSMHGRLSRWLSLRKLGLYSSGMSVRLWSCRFNHFLQCGPEDIDDFHTCEDALSIELGECFEGCGAISACIIQCTDDYEAAVKDCPCMEGCPGGCPCPNWDCDAAVPSQVGLVL